jgi:hypothetical protein
MGGRDLLVAQPEEKVQNELCTKKIKLITTKFFKLPIMWVYISCHLKLNYLFNKSNPIPVIVSTDKKEMLQKTQYSYSNERKCS